MLTRKALEPPPSEIAPASNLSFHGGRLGTSPCFRERSLAAT
jgi:hypothetical protein